jgi:hypothetical protein
MRLTSLRVHRRKAVVEISLSGSSRSSPFFNGKANFFPRITKRHTRCDAVSPKRAVQS